MNSQNQNQDQELRSGEEHAMEGLLREAGPRAEPSPETRQQVRQAVHAEWQAAVHSAAAARSAAPARTRRWQRPALALAASLAVAAVTLGIVQWQSTTVVPVARVARLSGAAEVRDASIKDAAGWQPVVMGQVLASGQELVTGSTGKVALALPDGSALRVDTDTRLRMAAVDRVVVERGVVYLDAGLQRAADTGDLRIDTAYGRTRHLGTQYEVDVNPDRMLVSVREGRVAVSRTGALSHFEAPFVAGVGEQLSVDQIGTVQRGVVARRDAHWDWIAEVTPPFAIENRRLSDFLLWVSRETGRDLAFSSSNAKTLAHDMVLRGSVAGMTPDEALAAVMATTNLTYSSSGGQITIRSLTR